MGNFRVVYPGRHPKGKDLLNRAFYAAGSLCRGLGVALDELGVMVMASQAVRQPRELRPGS